MSYKKWLTGCLLVVAVQFKPVLAQETVTLPQILEQAVSEYPTIEARQASVKQADYNLKLTKTDYLPQVQIQAQQSLGSYKSTGAAFFPVPGIFNISGNNTGNSSWSSNLMGSALLDWKFMQFGKFKNAVEASNIQVDQAQSELKLEELKIQAAISKDYVELLYHQHMLRWAANSSKRFSDLMQISRSVSLAGISPGADSLLVKASLLQANSDQKKWEGEAVASKIKLSQWMSSSRDFQVNEKPYYEAIPAVDGGESTIDHPFLKAKENEVAYSQAQGSLSRSSIYPDVSLLAGAMLRGSNAIGEGYPDASWSDVYRHPADNYLIGLGITWNLSNIYSQRIRTNFYGEKTRQRKAELEAIHLELSRQHDSAREKLDRQRMQIEDVEAAYFAARSAYRLFEARYSSGIIGLAELLQIQQVLQQAEKSRVSAYFQYWMQTVEMAEVLADFSLLTDVFS